MKITDLGNPKNYKQVIATTTVRSFNGGWNTADADLTMKPEFARVLDNMERGIDGTLTLRPGTALFSDIGAGSYIINMVYFNNQLIAVNDLGHVYSIASNGTATHMQVAAADPWDGASGDIDQVNFTIFNADLILVDGIHKPLVIEGKPFVPGTGAANTRYNVLNLLGDAGSAYSNVNTPIALFVVAHGRYVIMANLAADGSAGPKASYLSISNRDTGGTYVGDAGTNDAVEIDLGPRVSLGSSDITGIVSYRDKLLVTFERGVLPMTLGIYEGSPTAVHVPKDDGFFPEYGCMSHRSLVSVGDDAFYCDNIGVNSITRVTLTNTLRPVRASQLIDSEITELLRDLTPAQIAAHVFSVFDIRNRRYMLFVPSSDFTSVTGFSYTNIPALKVNAWARLVGWNWRCACRTALQDIYFAVGTKVYRYDFDNDTTNADFLNDPAVNGGAGQTIDFTWELPWADFSKRMNVKHSVYVSMDTTGTAEFTLKMYVDNIRLDRDGNDAPALSTVFEGGSLGGYGVAPYGSTPFGSGVPTADERLYSWPAAFKLAKFVATGSTTKPLRIVSLSIAYLGGSIRR